MKLSIVTVISLLSLFFISLCSWYTSPTTLFVTAQPTAASPEAEGDGDGDDVDVDDQLVNGEDYLEEAADAMGLYPYAEGDELEMMCASYEFPAESFSAQSDVDKVYLRIDEVGEGVFKKHDLTHFASAFGVRIVGHESVEADKILHITNLVAQLMDNDGDGKVDSPKMQEQLIERYATMFIVSDQDYTNYLLSPEGDEGFPVELKYCPFSFDYEEISKIQPNGPVETNCPSDLFTKDRSVAFASDHLIGRGWPKLLIDDDEEMESSPVFKEFVELYQQSVSDKTFILQKTGCPAEDEEYCGMVMYASWAVTTYLGIDKCWCESVGAWALCDEGAAGERYPKLVDFIRKHLVKVVPDGVYQPSDPSVIVREGEDGEGEPSEAQPLDANEEGEEIEVEEADEAETDEVGTDEVGTDVEPKEDDVDVEVEEVEEDKSDSSTSSSSSDDDDDEKKNTEEEL